MLVHAIDNRMLLEGVFRALYRSCNLQGVLEFDSVDVALVPQTLSSLGFAKGMGPFPHDGCWGISLLPQ